MIDDELKIISLALIGALAIVAVYPIIDSQIIVEPFSEIGILGPEGKAGGYPTSVAVGEVIELYVYVGDHEGKSEFYRINVKLGSQSDNVTDTKPLDLTPIESWDLFLADDQNITIPASLLINEPGINRKLVFELEMFDLGINDFVYKTGAHLWLNVTMTS